jgi:hypothetical protein
VYFLILKIRLKDLEVNPPEVFITLNLGGVFAGQNHIAFLFKNLDVPPRLCLYQSLLKHENRLTIRKKLAER